MQPNHLLAGAPRGVMQTFFQTKEAKELRECTFKPYVSEASRKLSENRRQIPTDSLSPRGDKCAELYDHAKQVIQVKANTQDRSTEEVEFERGRVECTFKPHIHEAPPAPKPSKRPTMYAQSHYERLNRAREEKERVKEITERGYSGGRKSEVSKSHFASVKTANSNAVRNDSQKRRPSSKLGGSESSKLNRDLRIPQLLVDIGIGNRKERIAVYEGDSAEVLAREFCIRHGLDIATIASRLKDEIERQIQIITNGQQVHE